MSQRAALTRTIVCLSPPTETWASSRFGRPPQLPRQAASCAHATSSGRNPIPVNFEGPVWAGVQACVTGVPCFRVAAGPWLMAGQVKDRAEPGRRGGAGGVLEVTGHKPMLWQAGNGSREACGYLIVWSVPMSGYPRVAGSAAGCSHPFAGPGRGRGAWGGSASGSGQAGSIKGAPAPPGRWGRHRGDLAPGRWPCKPFMRPVLAAGACAAGRGPGPGSGSARRASRRRSG
jgi:hypothetical protein